MCAGVSTHSLRTRHWGWRHRSRVIRTVTWRRCCLCRTDHYSERSHLNIQALSFFSHFLVDMNQVQSIQSRVSMSTVNNGKEMLRKRQQSFIWGGVNLAAEFLKCFVNYGMLHL